MGTLKLGRWVLGGVVVVALGCSSPPEDEGSATGPAAPTAAALPAPIEGCGGELRLLEGNRVLAAGRTVDCGQLDQLLLEGTIEHTCLGAIAKNGGRACIERFVEQSRSRAPQRPGTPVEP